jgi:hypothetical protein
MNPELISRLIGLVEKTGDRVVLADPETGKAVVVMDLPSYEKLCMGGVRVEKVEEKTAPAVTKDAVKDAPAPEARNTPFKSPKTAENKANTAKAAKMAEAAPSVPVQGALVDLTQAELLDKINREIAAWKTAQEDKHADELKAAALTAIPFAAAGVFEEEERFYLEPIE